jgi:hypothetical protein
MKAVMMVPTALMERLGDKGTIALTELLDDHRRAATDEILEKTAERFERRLVEETSKLRVDVAEMRTDLHRELVSGRFELLKWAFAFWAGQVVAMVAVVGVMLHGR